MFQKLKNVTGNTIGGIGNIGSEVATLIKERNGPIVIHSPKAPVHTREQENADMEEHILDHMGVFELEQTEYAHRTTLGQSRLDRAYTNH